MLEYELRINFARNFKSHVLELGTQKHRLCLVSMHQESLYLQLHFCSGDETH